MELKNVMKGALLAACLLAGRAWADELVINEIFWDAPESQDPTKMYIEIRGTPNMLLDHHYLVFLENEKTTKSSNPGGNVDGVFNLSGMRIGTNGYLLLLPKDFDRGTSYIAPGTAIYQNTDGKGFGYNGTSTIGYSSQDDKADIENGGFCAILVRTSVDGSGSDINAPYINEHLDGSVGQQTGSLNATATSGWTILDGIGQAEPGEERTCFTYGTNVFFTKSVLGGVKDSMTHNVFADIEPEYIFRWGDQNLGNPSDWAVANITNDPFSFNSANYLWAGYVVSGNHVAADPLPGELIRGLAVDDLAPGYQMGQRNMAPEGTIIQNTLGSPNYPIPYGDLNQDGVVDFNDLLVVLSNFGIEDQTLLGNWAFGDITGDGIVDYDDYLTILSNFSE